MFVCVGVISTKCTFIECIGGGGVRVAFTTVMNFGFVPLFIIFEIYPCEENGRKRCKKIYIIV